MSESIRSLSYKKSKAKMKTDSEGTSNNHKEMISTLYLDGIAKYS